MTVPRDLPIRNWGKLTKSRPYINNELLPEIPDLATNYKIRNTI